MAWNPTRPGNTRAARTMRARVLAEEPTCRAEGCLQASTQDDHVVGWSQREAYGMTISEWHARSNHQGLCATHHAAKTSSEATAGIDARVQQRRLPAEPHPGRIPPRA